MSAPTENRRVADRRESERRAVKEADARNRKAWWEERSADDRREADRRSAVPVDGSCA